ncbi:MAG: FadR family transcriptional regulator, partial [Spirochaetales bacterium]|nr:FadR family transcriptional regulator [Spirochaetales bacterium]
MTFEKVSVKETLAEKVCSAIKDAILSGEFRGGDLLPSEPNLEKQFGVSRAVVRDAVRMLKALGLVDVRHGKGMYVSLSQREAFTGALLLSLQREGGTVWDV